MKQLSSEQQYLDIVEKYRKKESFTNDYTQREIADLIAHERIYMDCYANNVFFFVKQNVGMRVYYYINDLNEKADFCTYNDLVVEILFRGVLPINEIDYLVKCGFRTNLVRDQYAAIYKDIALNIALIPGVDVKPARTKNEVKVACELFNETFDRLSGDFIPETEYEDLLKSGNILIAWNINKTSILGALHQVKEGSVHVIGHVAVMKHARGQGVGKALVDAFVEWNKNPENMEKTRYQLWVQQQNEAAVKMYKNKGFKFLNKSTISLIK